MIVCRRVWSALTPRPAHRVHHIVRHIRRAHHAYRAHWVSRVVCYAVAGGMALGGAAMLARPPVSGDWAPWPASVPGPQLLPPSAFVSPAFWPAIVPAAFGTPGGAVPIDLCRRQDTRPECRKHKRHDVPEPGALGILAVAVAGLAVVRRRA